MNGGDDGTRNRGFCRDSPEKVVSTKGVALQLLSLVEQWRTG